MQKKDNRTMTALQLSSLLYFSGLFVFVSIRGPFDNPLSAAVFSLLGTGVLFLMLLPLRPCAAGLVSASPGLRVLFWAAATFSAAETAFRLLIVLSRLMDGMFDPLVAVLLLLGALAFLSGSGPEALGRASSILLFFAVLCHLFLLFGAADQVHFINLVPPEYDSGTPGRFLLPSFSSAALLLYYPFLRERTAGKRKHIFRWPLIGCAFSGFFLFTLTALVTGDLAGLSFYPVHTLCRTADLSGISGLTPVFWFLLVVSAAVRLGLSFLLALEFWPVVRMQRSGRQWAENGVLMALLTAVHFSGGRNDWLTVTAGIFSVLCWAVLLFISLKKEAVG